MAEESFTWRDFSGLGAGDLYDLLRLRSQVFVVEQRCIFLDLDDRDQLARHLLVKCGESLCAYARLVPPSDARSAARIERLVVDPAMRGRGLGRRALTEALAEASRLSGEATIEISAQCQLERFYRAYGFERASETYLDHGIPHCRMVLRKPGPQGVEQRG